MKDYKLTKQQVEDLVNTKVLPIIKEKGGEAVQAFNTLAFFYSVGRLHSLEVLMKLSKYLTQEEITGLFKE